MTDERESTSPAHEAGELLAQGSLTNARLTGEDDQRALTHSGSLEREPELSQLTLTADERWPLFGRPGFSAPSRAGGKRLSVSPRTRAARRIVAAGGCRQLARYGRDPRSKDQQPRWGYTRARAGYLLSGSPTSAKYPTGPA
jgi:hypothetical protein